MDGLSGSFGAPHRYLACRPAVPALVNVSPVKWALVKFTSLSANSAQTIVILPPTNLAPPGHAPLPQLAQSRPRPERHHLGLRAQVPGSTMLARGTGDWAARSRRCHGGHERLQRSLAPSCHAGIPLPQVTRQLPHHRRQEPRERRQHCRQRPGPYPGHKPQHHRGHDAEHGQRDSPRIDPHRTTMAHNTPAKHANPADAASGKPGNEQRIAIPGLTARRSSSAPAPSAATSGHHDRTDKRLDRSPSGRPVSKHAGRSEREIMPDTRPRRPAAPHAACSGHGCSVP